MKRTAIFPMRGAALEPHSLQVGDAFVRVHPNPSDVPTAFSVTIQQNPPHLQIGILYPGGDREPRVSRTVGPVTAAIGIHSGRLFSLEMDFSDMQGFNDLSHEQREQMLNAMAKALASAIRWLHENTPRTGPRMNLEMAQRGLDLDETLPPAWMIKAFRENDSGRPSRP